MPVRIDRLDHFVLTVKDIDATCAFYSRVLGMDARTFGDGRRSLHFGATKINLHQQGREFEPKAARPGPGSADVCLIAATPLAEVIRHLHECGVEIIEGPVQRSGAIGSILSVYLRDPDGNLIEISNYN
jgi:catechol 2,3-dioxygenase-like lactoylglutathione lyase family enzyme